MRKIVVLLLVLTSMVMAYRYWGRSFYTLSNGECVTVWKGPGEFAYIIPSRYLALSLPDSSTSHIRINRMATVVDLVWIDVDSSWLVSSPTFLDYKTQVAVGDARIERCNDQDCKEAKNLMDQADSRKYKSGVLSVQIYVKDGHARVRDGSTVL